MRKISAWGKTHKWSARILIVTGLLLLNVIAFTAGLFLRDLDIFIPGAVFILSIILYCSGFILYPYKSEKAILGRDRFYFKQKSMDVVILTATYLVCLCIGNSPERLGMLYEKVQSTPISSTLPVRDSSISSYKSIPAFTASMKNENGKTLKWKERKKLLKIQVQSIKQSKELSDGVKILLIFLSVAVAIGLIALVAALACELSCGGSDVLAILVMAGGGFAIVLGLLAVIRAINGKKRKPKPDPVPE